MESKLNQFADIVMGQSPKGEDCNPSGIGLPLLNGPTEFGEHHPVPVQYTTDPRKIAQAGDILFCVRGSTTGKMNLADQKYAIGRGLAAIRHKQMPELQPFVRAVVEYGLGGLLAKATGSTFPNVSFGLIANLWWPPISENEQRSIAQFLGSLDDKIELNRQMNRTLEEMVRAIFKSWFVDFDPVRAKAEGRDPGLPPEIADLFPDGFEESGMGEIPRGWRIDALGEVAENTRRGAEPGKIESSTPYIALEHMPKRSVALSEWGEAGGVGSNKFQFNKGEILFGKLRPYFHKVGVAPINGVCSTDIVVIIAQPDFWLGFVLGHVSSDAFVDYTNAGSTGTRMPRTNWGDMAKYKVVFPPQELANTYNNFILLFINRIIANIHEGKSLSQIRDALLPRLISGEFRLEE